MLLRLTILFMVLVFTSCESILIKLSGEKPTIELRHNKAVVNGVLGKRFYKKFTRFIAQHPQVKEVVLEKVPGSANDEWNVKSCVLLHQKGMNTTLLSNSVIESGGVDLFISGNQRTIAPGAKIGVHSWSDGRKDGIEYPRHSAAHDIFLETFAQINMDTAFYWFTLRAAPADSMHYMTPQEIERYGLAQ